MGLLDGIRDKKHILLVSSPGSGSTWLGKILSATMDYSYIHEPDDEKNHFFGYYAKQGLPRFPIIEADKENERIHELFQMSFFQPYITSDSYSNQLLKKWINLLPENVDKHLLETGENPKRNLRLPYVFAHVFPKQLGNRNNRVVKSTQCIFLTDYLLHTFEGIQPIFMMRHPAAIIHRLLEKDDHDIDRNLYYSPILLDKNKRLHSIDFQNQKKEFLGGIQIALIYQEIQRLVAKYPNSKIVYFEDLVEDPFLFSFNLYKELDIKWNDNVELYIGNSNQYGAGAKARKELKMQSDKWKRELSEAQIEQIRYGYQLIEGLDFYKDF